MPAVQDGRKNSIMIFYFTFSKRNDFLQSCDHKLFAPPFGPKFYMLVTFIFMSHVYDKISIKTKVLPCQNRDFRALFATLIPNVFLFTGTKPLVLWLAHGAR